MMLVNFYAIRVLKGKLAQEVQLDHRWKATHGVMRETLSYCNKCLTSTCGLRERVVLMEWLGFLVSVVLRYNKAFCQSCIFVWSHEKKSKYFSHREVQVQVDLQVPKGILWVCLRKTATNVRCRCSFRLEPSFSSSDLCVFHQGDPGDEGDIGEPGPSGQNVMAKRADQWKINDLINVKINVISDVL